ncbi:MAG TPA: hypothetical protein PKW80_13715, partial [Bacteroidales bacterium]|nr:hypothetical protein [Bacteroidales bacterium]
MKEYLFINKVIIILFFLPVYSNTCAQTLNFSFSKDTISTGELLTIYNLSSGFSQNTKYVWEFGCCEFFINDTTMVCSDTTIVTTDTIAGKFYHDTYCLITIMAIDSLGNVIDSIPFYTKTVYVK